MQNVFFIWNGLYLEVFLIYEKKDLFQSSLSCYWEVVAIWRDVIGREFCTLNYLGNIFTNQ